MNGKCLSGLTRASMVSSWLMNVVNDGKAPWVPMSLMGHTSWGQVPVKIGSSSHPHWLLLGLFPSISLHAGAVKSVFSVFSHLPSALPFQPGWRCGWGRKSREASLSPDGPLKAKESETMSHLPTEYLNWQQDWQEWGLSLISETLEWLLVVVSHLASQILPVQVGWVQPPCGMLWSGFTWKVVQLDVSWGRPSKARGSESSVASAVSIPRASALTVRVSWKIV